MPDDLERLLRTAFDAHARGEVRDDVSPPAARYLVAEPRQHRRWLAPVAAAAAVVAVGASLLALEGGSGKGNRPVLGAPTVQPASSGISTAPAAPVHIRLLNADGAHYGVGMPVVAYFDKQFRSAKPLAAATSVTVNGKPVRAAWYFLHSSQRGYPIEGHLRMRDYWPAHARVHVAIAANAITPSAALDFQTGARTIAVVSDAKHEMAVTRDGKSLGAFPVSLGTAATPTERGTKVIMAKKPSICLSGPGFHQCGVMYAQQVTDNGEYLIGAPWNPGVKGGWDSSNGCTNLTQTDAKFLYRVLNVGDVVDYQDSNGPMMQADGGLGDWNVRWSTWLRGGLIPTG